MRVVLFVAFCALLALNVSAVEVLRRARSRQHAIASASTKVSGCPAIADIFAGCYGVQRAWVLSKFKGGVLADMQAFCGTAYKPQAGPGNGLERSYADVTKNLPTGAPANPSACAKGGFLTTGFPQDASCGTGGVDYVSNVPTAKAPTILGTKDNINRYLTGKDAKSVWRLWAKSGGVENDKCWSSCFNLAFVLCGANGAFPQQGGAGSFILTVPGNGIAPPVGTGRPVDTTKGAFYGANDSGCSVTGNELCLLKTICTNDINTVAQDGTFDCGKVKNADLA